MSDEENAIELFEKQRKAIDNFPNNKDEFWRNQTLDLIEKFIGKDSQQYKYIRDHTFWPNKNAIIPETNDSRKERGRNMVDDCISYIKSYGVKKDPDQIGYILVELYTDKAAAEYNRECQDFMAKQAQKNNRRLGATVTILSAIVGSGVFATLRKNTDEYLRVITAVLSVITTVLVALQSFFGFGKEVENHKKMAHAFDLIYNKMTNLFATYRLHTWVLPQGVTEEELGAKAREIRNELVNAKNNAAVINDAAKKEFIHIVSDMKEWLKGHAEKANKRS